MLSQWIECLKMGLRELSRHRLRSGLTMLGMMMGVSVVIICISVVQGVKNSLIDDIRKAGRNMILVINRESTKKSKANPLTTVSNLTRSDAEAIQSECDSVAATSPTHGNKLSVVSDVGNTLVDIIGANQAYTSIRNWAVGEGRDLEPFDVVAARRVCLIGQTAARELFGDRSPVNRNIRVGQLSLRVVGQLEPKGVNPLGMDEDNTIVMPLPIMLRDISGITEPSVIICSAKSDAEVERAVSQIRDLLRQRHRLGELDEDDFKVTTLKEKEEQARSISDQMTLLMFFLGMVSLAVGGVGIMTIMLVAVTERTREIGIRMAIGATTRAISRQFLVEAAVISTSGGVIGVLLGVAGSILIGRQIGIQPLMSAWLIGLAFAFSAGVGVVFGLLPARRAAGLNPIEALRHD